MKEETKSWRWHKRKTQKSKLIYTLYETPSPRPSLPPQTCKNEVPNGKAIQGHESWRRKHGRVPREAGSSQAVAAEGSPSQFAEALAQTTTSAGGPGASFALWGKRDVAEGKSGWMMSDWVDVWTNNWKWNWVNGSMYRRVSEGGIQLLDRWMDD